MMVAGTPPHQGERGCPHATEGKDSAPAAKGAIVTHMSAGPRFLTLADVAEILNTSLAQVTALVRRGELRALKLGGRGQWRIEISELEAFIERMYVETQEHLRAQQDEGTSST
jgi:excisionase family DNA binding protein